MQFFFNLSRNVGKNESNASCRIHTYTCYTLQSRASICNLFETNFMQSFQKGEPSSTLRNCCKPKKLGNKLRRGHVTRCKLPSTFLAKSLQHNELRHVIILAVDLNSTFSNDCRDFLNHCKLQPEIATCAAIFILVVSSAALLHDVSAHAGDVSMGIAVFPTG